jgi:hypothetical protein
MFCQLYCHYYILSIVLRFVAVHALHCAVVLCCVVLCCIVLCCVVLCCVVLCCVVLCCVVLCCVVLYTVICGKTSSINCLVIKTKYCMNLNEYDFYDCFQFFILGRSETESNMSGSKKMKKRSICRRIFVLFTCCFRKQRQRK